MITISAPPQRVSAKKLTKSPSPAFPRRLHTAKAREDTTTNRKKQPCMQSKRNNNEKRNIAMVI